MALNINEIVETVKRILSAGAGDGQANPWNRPELDLGAMRGTACQRLAARIAKDSVRRSLMQQNYVCALDGSGIADPLSEVGTITGDTDIYWDSIPWGNVQDLDNNSLVYLPSLYDFYRPASTAFGYYTLVNQRLRTRAIGVGVTSAADVVGVNGPVTVTASYVTTDLSFWDAQFFDDMVQEILHIAQTKLAELNA